MSAHTPGPWKVNRNFHSGGELWLSILHHTQEGTDSPEGRWIGPVAEISHVMTPEAEVLANFQLIAAAPELLETLQNVRCSCTTRDIASGHLVDCWMPAVVDVIDKATL